ncbi:hypothetical protein FHG87_024359 [Trinorchestia longiramus]|nr:hypothetical protein FHG87_024359 [Trinorchestia longiramus]
MSTKLVIVDQAAVWETYSESHGFTINKYHDEARFIDQRANKTEEVNPATRLGPVTTRSTTLTNDRSRSGSRAQLTALYNEAATLCDTDFLPNASKINIFTKTPHQPFQVPESKFPTSDPTGAMAQREVHFPSFGGDMKAWLLHCEVFLAQINELTDREKYGALLGALPTHVVAAVQEVLLNHPVENKFETPRTALQEKFVYHDEEANLKKLRRCS